MPRGRAANSIKYYSSLSSTYFSKSELSNLMLIDVYIFILLSRESDGGAVHRTNPDSLRSCPCFRVFRLSFASDFFNFLRVKFHKAKKIVVKHLKDATTRLGWELNHQPCDHGRRKNDAPNHSAMLPTI